MSGRRRSLSRAKEKPPVMVEHEVKDGYLLTKETGDAMREALAELPHKYVNIGPIIQALMQSPRVTTSIELPFGQTVPTLTKRLPVQKEQSDEKAETKEAKK